MKRILAMTMLLIAGCANPSPTPWQVHVDSQYRPFIRVADGRESGLILCTLVGNGDPQQFYVVGEKEELQKSDLLKPSSVFHVRPFKWDEHEHSKFKEMSVEWSRMKIVD